MSWDIMIFSSKQKIETVEAIEEAEFTPIEFDAVLAKECNRIAIDEELMEIKGVDYTIRYFKDIAPTGYLLFNLYGENALYELIRIAKMYNWQIFDTGNGEMIDLDQPEKNGYEDFQNYLHQVLKTPGE